MYSLNIEDQHKHKFLELLLEADPSPQMIGRYLDAGTLFACRAGDALVGVAVILDCGDGLRELMNLAVRPCSRGQGIGTWMMQRLIRWCREEARPVCERLRLGTSPAGKTIMDFYGSFGFVYHHTREHFFLENYPEPIYEDGGLCDDMIVLELDFRTDRLKADRPDKS